MEFKPNIKTEEKPTVENNTTTKEKIDQAKESLDNTIKELNDSMSHVEKSSPGRIEKIIAYLKEKSGDIIRLTGTAVFGTTSLLFAIGQMQGNFGNMDLTTVTLAAAAGVITTAGFEIATHNLYKGDKQETVTQNKDIINSNAGTIPNNKEIN